MCRSHGMNFQIVESGENGVGGKSISQGEERFGPMIICGGQQPMYGEKGLRTKWYYLRFMLARLYDKVIYDSDNCIVTQQGRRLAILCHNDNSIDIPGKGRLEMFMHIEDIECNYTIVTYTIDLSNGGEDEMWRDIGAPEEIQPSLREVMRSCCFPEVSHTYYTVQYDLFRDITLQPGELKLMLMIPDGNQV